MSRRASAPAAARWTVYIGIAIVFAISAGLLLVFGPITMAVYRRKS